MVTLSPGSEVLKPHLELAGALKDGTEVQCSVVMSGVPDAETFLIITGCGASASLYYDLQTEAAKLGVNSFCLEPIYKLSKRPNRLQAESAEVVVHYAEDKYEVPIGNAYGHSWGGSKLGLLIHHGIPGLRRAIFHNTAGFESAFGNIAGHPIATAGHYRDEITHVSKRIAEQGIPNSRDFFRMMGRLPVMLQHNVVASQYRQLLRHLQSAKDQEIWTAGLWPRGGDIFFKSQGNEIFDYNEVLPDSVHAEPQCNPARVARKMVELAAAA